MTLGLFVDVDLSAHGQVRDAIFKDHAVVQGREVEFGDASEWKCLKLELGEGVYPLCFEKFWVNVETF